MSGPVFKDRKPLFRDGKPAFDESCCDCYDPEDCVPCAVLLRGGVFIEEGTKLYFEYSDSNFNVTLTLTMPTANSRLVEEGQTVSFTLTQSSQVIMLTRFGPSWDASISPNAGSGGLHNTGFIGGLFSEYIPEEPDSIEEGEPYTTYTGSFTYDAHWHSRLTSFPSVGWAWIYFDFCNLDLINPAKGTLEVEVEYCGRFDTGFCYRWNPTCEACCFIFNDATQEYETLPYPNEAPFPFPTGAVVTIPEQSREPATPPGQSSLISTGVSGVAMVQLKTDKGKVCEKVDTETDIRSESVSLTAKIIGPPMTSDPEHFAKLEGLGWFFEEGYQPVDGNADINADGRITKITWRNPTSDERDSPILFNASAYFIHCEKDENGDPVEGSGSSPSDISFEYLGRAACIQPVGSKDAGASCYLEESTENACDRSDCCDLCCFFCGKSDPITLTVAGTLKWYAGADVECEDPNTATDVEVAGSGESDTFVDCEGATSETFFFIAQFFTVEAWSGSCNLTTEEQITEIPSDTGLQNVTVGPGQMLIWLVVTKQFDNCQEVHVFWWIGTGCPAFPVIATSASGEEIEVTLAG